MRLPSWFLTEQEAELRPPNPEPSVLAILLDFLHPYDDQDARKHLPPFLTAPTVSTQIHPSRFG